MQGFDLSTISNCYIGSTQVREIWYSNTQIWPPHDYSQDPLTFEVLEAGQFKFKYSSANSSPMRYSLDNGVSYITMQDDTWTATIPAGSKMLLDCYEPTSSTNIYGIGTFSSTGNFNVSGNIGTILEGYLAVGLDPAAPSSWPSLASYQFGRLFKDCTHLISAEHLYLPTGTIIDYCYEEMFRGCTSLVTPPELPATTLADYCYAVMFDRCSSLTTAPELPATTLATCCYFEMFYICTSLTTPPELPATTLANDCYNGMFSGCSSLTTAPELPATTLVRECYYDMFSGCTSLTQAPELLAPTLAVLCYGNMFNSCTSLNYVKCLATDLRDATYQTTVHWLDNVSSTGTFIKDANTTWPTGGDGIPSGWTIINNA